MHDIDRTQREWETAIQPEAFEYAATGQEGEGLGEWEGQGELYGEQEYEALGEAGGLGEYGEYEGAFEAAPSEYGEGEMPGEFGEYEYGAHEYQEMPELQESPLHEAQEMELAAELLEVTNEYELEQFLGKLIRRVGRGLGKVVRGPIGKALGGFLKPLAKIALPIAGKALGGFVGGPVGAMLGGKLASMAGQAFGLELEGLSQEDREFEVARRYVRMAAAATRNALSAPPTAPSAAVARRSVARAAQVIAPAIQFPTQPYPPTPVNSYPSGAAPVGGRRRGIWVRRGRGILLLGV